MSYKIYTVNEAGMKYISEFIKERLKNGHLLYDDKKCLNAWAREAENSIGEVGHPMFEIHPSCSTSGISECCYLDLIEHFDEEEIEE